MSKTAIFGAVAPTLRNLGLAPIPCGGEDGKRPLVNGFGKWRYRPSPETIARWDKKYTDANVGVLCQFSSIVVVDIDDPGLVQQMLLRFGKTPLMTRTPSGGAHLWYRSPGSVRSRNLRTRENIAVDIKADGGLVIVPPSISYSSGSAYAFEQGSWDDLTTLPLIAASSLR